MIFDVNGHDRQRRDITVSHTHEQTDGQNFASLRLQRIIRLIGGVKASYTAPFLSSFLPSFFLSFLLPSFLSSFPPPLHTSLSLFLFPLQPPFLFPDVSSFPSPSSFPSSLSSPLPFFSFLLSLLMIMRRMVLLSCCIYVMRYAVMPSSP